MTPAFEFEIEQAIIVRALSAPGAVSGRMETIAGLQYRVVWWCNGVRNEEWLYDWEIRAE